MNRPGSRNRKPRRFFYVVLLFYRIILVGVFRMDNDGVQSTLYNKAIKNDSIESFRTEKAAYPLKLEEKS